MARAIIALAFWAFLLSGIREPDAIHAGGITWGTIAALTFATLLARLRTGPGRDDWFGFALFGWVYFLAVLGPLGAPTAVDLPSRAGLRLARFLHPDSDAAMRGKSPPDLGERIRYCSTILHCGVSWIVGIAGLLLVRFVRWADARGGPG